jgi:hypothetical protein
MLCGLIGKNATGCGATCSKRQRLITIDRHEPTITALTPALIAVSLWDLVDNDTGIIYLEFT